MQRVDRGGDVKGSARKGWVDSPLRRSILKVGKKLRPSINAILSRHSKVGDQPVFESVAFPWTAMLEANWEMIRREAEAVLEFVDRIPPLRQISPDHARIAGSDHWRSFFLHGYGLRSERNCARCPQTARLVEQIPDLQSALFSIMRPGTHVVRHTGPTKGLMTCHLALIIPRNSDGCLIEIDGLPYRWSEGKTLVFDDTYKHEAWNDTEEDRVVLLLHFLRPLRFPGNFVRWLFLTAIKLSPFVRDAHRKQTQWEEQLDGDERSP